MEKTKKCKIMSKESWFLPNPHETSGCYKNVKNDEQKIDIFKISTKDEWAAIESFSPLE